MAKSKQNRRRLYQVENTPVKETPRYEGDGTEWIFESPDGGKTVYKRAMGSDEKILVEKYRWEDDEEEVKQEWPGLDAINKEWV